MACPVNSSKWKIKVNGAGIAHLTNVRFGMQHATRDTTDKDTGRYATSCEGRITATGSGDFNVYAGASIGAQALAAALIGDQPATVEFVNTEDGQSFSGPAWISGLNIDAPGDNQNTTGSVEFQFTGEFAFAL